MKKKITISISVLAAFALLLAGYFAFLAPKASGGQKAVTVRVVAASENIDRTFSYTTGRSYVSELLEDNRDELEAELEDSQYGKFVSGMLGVKADSKKEYFNIKVDGADAAVGVSQLPLEDGKTYTFTLTAL